MFWKKCSIALALCSLFAVSVAGQAAAEDGICTGAEVVFAGAHVVGKVVYLKNTRTDCGNWPQNAYLFFILDNTTGNANGMVAAALAAQAAGKPVVAVPLDVSGGGQYSNWATLAGIYAMQ